MDVLKTAVSNLQSLLEKIEADSKLVVGVSGGADSLALLHAVWRTLGATRLVVGHLNHGLRETAVAHAAHVQRVAESWGVVTVVKTVDVAAHAEQTKQSLEAAGRELRYQFLAELAVEHEAEAVLTGHHADDQAETVLLHLLRGSGLAGLRGMQTCSPLFCAPTLWHGRPFLNLRRADIEAYCRQHDIAWVEDETNVDPRFLRNRVRHELLPLLADLSPAVSDHLTRLADSVGADVDFLDAATAAAWRSVCLEAKLRVVKLDRAGWEAQPLALQRRLLRRAVAAVQQERVEISFTAVEDARQHVETGRSGGQLDLPGGVRLHVGYRELLFVEAGGSVTWADLPKLPSAEPLRLAVPGEVQLADGWRLLASVVDSPNDEAIEQNESAWVAFVATAATTLTVRGRQEGERLQPLGMNGKSTSLKKLMINRQIPAALRARWPLVVDGAQTLWVVGQQLDRRAAVTAEARRVVMLRCEPSV